MALLVVAIAVSGYVVATFCYQFKYHVARESGHRLYLSSLALGFACFVAALLPADVVLRCFPSWNDGVVRSVLTLAIALLWTFGYNRFKTNARENALWDAWQRDDLEHICGRASTEFKPIAVTLETNKVYVGFIGETIEPSVHGGYLSILPLYSGYRDKDTLEFRLIHRYDSLFESMLAAEVVDKSTWSDYLIVIPRERIVTLHIFNDHVYQHVSGSAEAS